LLLNGQIIVASAAWWDLRPTECYLINLLNMLVGDVTCRDTPIYLPNKNPHVNNYFMTSEFYLKNELSFSIIKKIATITAFELQSDFVECRALLHMLG
jgi:hypothetical protein